ncbi:MAG: hypothetical protein IT464_07870 [Planctomycetes bacterium]|nr:hypothetical protein [Planctomycetota bacterium]
MVKLASILAALYLSIAPGMSVARLLHAVELCKLFETQVQVAQTHTCGDHEPEAPDQPEERCPLQDDLAMQSGAMAVPCAPAELQAAPAWQLEPAFVSHQSTVPQRAAAHVERPPPNPPWVGVTLLLV